MKAETVILKCGSDILTSPLVLASRDCVQHGSISVYTHCLMVTKYALLLAKRLGIRCNLRSLVRGALLHDFFMYDWHWEKMPDEVKRKGLHGFTHPGTAARNAKKYFNVSRKVYDIINCHMFPLTLTRMPKSTEGWLVCLADKYCSTLETLRIQPYSDDDADILLKQIKNRK